VLRGRDSLAKFDIETVVFFAEIVNRFGCLFVDLIDICLVEADFVVVNYLNSAPECP